MEEFLGEKKRRIEGATATDWEIKEGVSCGGVGTNCPTGPWAFEKESEGRARCVQRANIEKID